jgi:hypothetical protein
MLFCAKKKCDQGLLGGKPNANWTIYTTINDCFSKILRHMAWEVHSHLTDAWAFLLRRSGKASRPSLLCENERSRHRTRVLQAGEEVRPSGRGPVEEGLTGILANVTDGYCQFHGRNEFTVVPSFLHNFAPWQTVEGERSPSWQTVTTFDLLLADGRHISEASWQTVRPRSTAQIHRNFREIL